LGCVLKVREDHAVLHAEHERLDAILAGRSGALAPGGHGLDTDFGYGSISRPGGG
jgi:hypothetical protein